MTGMRKKLLLIAVAMVTVSAVVATQYARADLSFSYTVVHPSQGFIRFIGGDNNTNGERIFQGNNATTTFTLSFGNDITHGMNKTYTAAFAIVNEEGFKVNITDIDVAGDSNYIKVWLHGDPTQDASSEAGAVLMWDGSNGDPDNSYWTLGAGNGNPSDISADGTTQISTPWDYSNDVRYCEDTTAATNGTSDYVWVQVTILAYNAAMQSYSGTITFYFEASTH